MGMMDGLKQAASTLREADKIPEYNAILDAQQRIFDLQNENQELKEKVRKLHQSLELKGKFSFDAENGVYRLENDSRAFCPVCYEKEAQLSTLRWVSQEEWTPYYYCNICEKSTYKSGYRA